MTFLARSPKTPAVSTPADASSAAVSSRRSDAARADSSLLKAAMADAVEAETTKRHSVLADEEANESQSPKPRRKSVAAKIPNPVARKRIASSKSGAAYETEFDVLFARWKESGDPVLRERMILMHRPLVAYLARRFSDRGEAFDDIVQQGLVGLINALDHFDARRGVRFATFATPTIVGEIRRYFRDKTWSVRVPRRLQELHQAINRKVETLSQELDRSPSYEEIARALGIEIEQVVEALEIIYAADPSSLDESLSGDENSVPIGDSIGTIDPAFGRVDEFNELHIALEQLSVRDQTVLRLAYFEGLSQAEISERIKVSPMHVSRLQRSALSRLREIMEEREEGNLI